MKAKVLVAAAVLLRATGLFGARVSFVRTVPATYDLAPAEQIAVTWARGDDDHVADFVTDFVDDVARSGAYRIEDATRSSRRRHADIYLGVAPFACRGIERSAEGSERDATGERIKRLHHWVDATCDARVHVLDANGKQLFSYSVRGEGTSPRSTELTADERAVAFAQAAHYAAVSAAEAITPRRVRESIELDESAPSFDEGMAMINSDRLLDARAIWEAALQRHRDSAPLRYDLGAVCEAAGDLKAARGYFESAVKLSSDRRYVREFDLFRKRNASRRP